MLESVEETTSERKTGFVQTSDNFEYLYSKIKYDQLIKNELSKLVDCKNYKTIQGFVYELQVTGFTKARITYYLWRAPKIARWFDKTTSALRKQQ